MRDSIEHAILEAEKLNGLPMAQTIKAWSHSRLATFEQCRFHAKLAYIDKIPELPRPLPPGKTEHANDRGTRVHEAAEAYVRGGVELVSELQTFATEFDQLRKLHAAGKVSLEGEWAFNREWKPTAWMSSDAWCRIKCDTVVFPTKSRAIVIDYKTGKRWGNEIKHAEQMLLYQLGVFLRYPSLQEVEVELWYTDLDDLHSSKFRRGPGTAVPGQLRPQGCRDHHLRGVPAKPERVHVQVVSLQA
jgi:hypothetical protein